LAKVDKEKCNACSTCVKVCPVEAIRLEKQRKKTFATVDVQRCYGCTICISRCPTQAIEREERKSPLEVGVNASDVSEETVKQICETAHMYPDQVVCFCHRVQAKEVVAAILKGAETPEEISRATGVRTGCGVLCITGIIRLLKAAGIRLEKAPGYQWYGTEASIWDIPEEVRRKYPMYFVSEDLLAINDLFPGGKQR
jgi:ferredoxin